MADSPEIVKTDTEVIIKFPKHSDLDIKFYNPEIMHSLGFVDATVHLDTQEPTTPDTQNREGWSLTQTQSGGGLFDYEAAPEQPLETMTYPYRYFAYMFRNLSPVSSGTKPEPELNQKEEKEPTGLLGTIMSFTNKNSGEEKKPEPTPDHREGWSSTPTVKEEQTPQAQSSGFFSMFLNKNKTPETAPTTESSILDSVEDHPSQWSGVVTPTVGDLTKNATVVEPIKYPTPEEKQPSLTGSDRQGGQSLMSIFSTQTQTQTQTTEEKQPSMTGPDRQGGQSLMESIFPSQTNETQPTTEEKQPSSIMETFFPTQPQTQTQTQPTENVTPPDVDMSKTTGSLRPDLTQTQPTEQEHETHTLNEVDPVVSAVPETPVEPPAPTPFAPVTTPFSAKWVIHVPIASNHEGVSDGKDPVVIDNARFEDVLLFAEMEARNGIYVRGEFVDVLGKYVKIGVVEQLNGTDKMRTVKEYLSGRVLLEGTKMQKYSLLFQ